MNIIQLPLTVYPNIFYKHFAAYFCLNKSFLNFLVAGWLILILGVIQLPIWIIVGRLKQEKSESYLDVSYC